MMIEETIKQDGEYRSNDAFGEGGHDLGSEFFGERVI